MAIYELDATPRTNVGKGASRRLRRINNEVPGILYGAGEPATPITLKHNQVFKALQSESFYSHILTIDVDGTKHQAVLKDVQRHPYKPRIQHMDFLLITGKEKIHMNVPLHFHGDEDAPGVKDDGGVISHVLSSVEVICFPKDLPEFIEVDVSQLKLDEAIHLSQLVLPPGVELADLSHGHYDDQTVASVHIPRAAIEDEETAAPVASEVPAINQTDEGEAGAAATNDDDK